MPPKRTGRNKKILFIGPVGCGKTTLINALKRNDGPVLKTQMIEYGEDVIDTPGEFLEMPRLISALVVTSAESDAVALLQPGNADESCYPPDIGHIFNKPLLGIVTKMDLPDADGERAAQFLKRAGAREVMYLSAVSSQGMERLRQYCQLDKSAQILWDSEYEIY